MQLHTQIFKEKRATGNPTVQLHILTFIQEKAIENHVMTTVSSVMSWLDNLVPIPTPGPKFDENYSFVCVGNIIFP